MNPMKAYETAKSLTAEQLVAAMKGGMPEIPAYIAASVMQEQKKVRDSAAAQAPQDKRTVMQELEEESPVGIAALPQMAQGGEGSIEGGIAGYAEGGQISTGEPTSEIKEQMKTDKTEKLMSDYAEYKANGGTEAFEVWMKNAPKGFAFGGMVEDEPTGDIDDLEREYAEYAGMQGFTIPQQAGAPYTANPAAQVSEAATPQGKMAFSDAITHTESRGRDFDSKGNPLKSSAGALFARQVMPKTAASPGFGIKPAQSQTPEEYNRVGKEYEAALIKRYDGNMAKAAAAYNAGQGTVDKAVRAAAKAGEPDNWRSYMRNHQSKQNFKQTDDYVNKIASLSGIRAYAEGGQVEGYEGWTPEEIKSYEARQAAAAKVADYESFKKENPEAENPYAAPSMFGQKSDIPSGGFSTDVYGQEYGFGPGDYNTRAEDIKLTTRPPAKPKAPAPVAAQQRTTAPITATSPAAGIMAVAPAPHSRSVLGMEDFYRMADSLIPKLDPKYAERIAKEEARLNKDRAGNFDRTLIDVGLGIMSGTSPHALVNAGTGATAGLKTMDARLAGYDKRGDALGQRDLLLAQAEQARAQGNVKLAATLMQTEDYVGAAYKLGKLRAGSFDYAVTYKDVRLDCTKVETNTVFIRDANGKYDKLELPK